MQELLNGRNDLNEKEVLEILQYYGTCDYNSVLSKQNSGYNCLTFGTYVNNFKDNTSKIYVYNKHDDVFDLNICSKRLKENIDYIPWNNKNLHLRDYYSKCKGSK